MESNCTLVLTGKSAAENEAAKSLLESKALKIAGDDGVSVFPRSEFHGPFESDSFRIDTFMDSLSTNRFGRFLAWSPRLPSTHDVVSL